MNEIKQKFYRKELKCENCCWYNPIDRDIPQGECREHAPDDGWDKVFPDDWCGDFQSEG